VSREEAKERKFFVCNAACEFDSRRLANWLLAEFDVARIRLAVAEVELQELPVNGVIVQPNAAPPNSAD
jgi:hypothetical protein